MTPLFPVEKEWIVAFDVRASKEQRPHLEILVFFYSFLPQTAAREGDDDCEFTLGEKTSRNNTVRVIRRFILP